MDLIIIDDQTKCKLCHQAVDQVNEDGVCLDCLEPDPCDICVKPICKNCKFSK